MRTVIVFTIAAACLVAGETSVLPSRIEGVTVFLDRAHVTRRGEVAVKAGVQELVFDGLPAEIDDPSLRCEVAGKARLLAVQVSPVTLDQHPQEQARAVQARIETLEAEERGLADTKALLDKDRASLEQLERNHFAMLAAGGKERPLPAIKDYAEFLDFLAQRRTESRKREREVGEGQARVQRDMEAARRELDERKAGVRLEQKRVTVRMNAEVEGQVAVTLTYLLPGALWFPSYDLRGAPAENQVEVTYAAVVQNATGEDWTDAALTLSAARPAVAMAAPEPTPWFLGRAVAWQSLGQIQLTDTDPALLQGNAQCYNGFFLNDSPVDNLNSQLEQRKGGRNKAWHANLLPNLGQVGRVFAAAEKRGSSVVFAVPGRSSVTCDGKPNRLTLAVATMPMQVRRYAVPRASLNCCRSGRFTNSGKLPLLPGTANVFLDGSLIGSTALDLVAESESGELPLGVDERVKVPRVLDRSRSSKSAWSKRKKLDLAYTIAVENFHDRPLAITVHESLPVSESDDIRVRVGDTEPEREPSDKGLVAWDLTLEPGKKQELRFGYSIEYPADLPVGTNKEVAPARQRLRDELFDLERKL